MAASAMPCLQDEYIDYVSGSAYADMLGQRYWVSDTDDANGPLTKNSGAQRELMFVQNGASALSAGMCLTFHAGDFLKVVDAASNTDAIRGYAPYKINGLTTNTIPANAYFLAVINGPCTVATDGSAISEGDIMIAGDTPGYVKKDNASPTANVSVRGGTAMADASARGTGAQVYVRINAKCDV